MKKLIFEEPKFEAVLFRTDDVAVVASDDGTNGSGAEYGGGLPDLGDDG